MMGGSYSSQAARRLVESAEREGADGIGRMRRVYLVDPTPALRERIERAESSQALRMAALRAAHERFESVMAPTDDELRIANSNDRIGRIAGDPELVGKILRRKMGQAEYEDLSYGPDVMKK